MTLEADCTLPEELLEQIAQQGHGFSLDSRMWAPQIAILQENCRVVSYDLRGFGKSSLPGQKAYRHEEDLKFILDQLEIETTILMGLSMGGEIAIDFALCFPERAVGLIVSDPSLGGGKKSTSSGLKGSGLSADEAFSRWIANPLFEQANRIPEARERLHSIVRDYTGWHWHNRDPVQKLEPPAAKQLEKLALPVLILVGELDLMDFQENAQLICNHVANSTKIIIRECGHLPNIERPEEYNSHILGFVEMLLNGS